VVRPTIPLDELIAYLFGADHSALAAEVGPWLASSPRFRAFAETYRDKIRKKVRGPREDEALRDLMFELAIALRMVEDRRFAVEYESYGMGQRAPDFRVTFRSGIRLNVEVRRLRGRAPIDTPSDPARITRAVVDKLVAKHGGRYEFGWVEYCDDALALLLRSPFDLVFILSLRAPWRMTWASEGSPAQRIGETGVLFLRRVRARDSPPPVIVISGTSFPEAKEMIAAAGAFFVPKPVDLRELLDTIALALSHDGPSRDK